MAAERPGLPEEELDEDRRLVLGDLINRVLDKGVVIAGDVVISIADIDLVRVEMHLLITAVESAVQRRLAVARSRRASNADVPVLPPRSGE